MSQSPWRASGGTALHGLRNLIQIGPWQVGRQGVELIEGLRRVGFVQAFVELGCSYLSSSGQHRAGADNTRSHLRRIAVVDDCADAGNQRVQAPSLVRAKRT